MALYDGRQSARTVEPNRQPGVARQLSAGASSANTALTSSCSRISIRAVTADTSQTANASTSHFIAQNERLELVVPEGANIAVKRDASTSGTLELTELF